MPGVSDSHWSAQDTTPAAVDAALRRMLFERHTENASYVPARALNLICVVDKQWSGEIANRLRQVGRYHASRTIVLEVEDGREQIDAVATIASDVHPKAGTFALLRETVVLDIGPKHLAGLLTLVDPLVVSDLPTVLWSPHGHPEAVEPLLGVAQVILVDSVDQPDAREGLDRAAQLAEEVYVVDLAYLRTTPWRERVAATFDPAHLREELWAISSVHVRHHPDSAASALLLVGWLGSRLGWELDRLSDSDGGRLTGHATGSGQDVDIALEPDRDLQVKGLAGLLLETASGRHLQLDRGPGGLHARYRNARGDEREWTVLGASRGEAGILGEGIRQALLRDPTYRPALAASAALAP
ncbi:MAG: glucose-6-phosphate dehydrogenase assembly protein OpcA [Solirubrobacteraceae bacterium]